MDPSMDDPMSEEEEDEDMDLPPGESRSSGGGSGSGSGGGGKGVVVKGVEIAEEDVYAYGDPDDPLDRVLDVYLADELEDHLYLLQYPMQPADRPSSTPLAVKVKAANHLLEVEHPIKQGGKHYDKNAPGQLRRATQKHTGSRVRPATNFAFGVIRSDELHLTPIHATMQMRPCFQHIDEAKAQEIEMDLDDPDNSGTKEAEKPQQVSFKKKESERATAARKSSYAYKKSIEDAEPWVALEVHGQNDDRSLDEFSRMFVDDDASANRGTTTKEFPPCERYLQGLDYMEEYDENGESFSAGGRGRRSLADSIDLVTAGTGTYSPVNLPAAPVHQLGGDAKVVGYLKLAHLVPFSMLLDVTNMSPDAVLQALSVEGRQKGLLMRGNWAALPADVWPRGPPHAADCLSVAQCLLHRYGAVSRPDLQRRFPELEPATLKELLSRIAELDTVDRRWVPKVKDGLTFGMEHPEIVELEEERWTLHESILKERLGDDILAPPSCPTFGTFVKVLEAAARAASAASASAARAPMSRAVPSFGVLRRGEVAAKQEITEEEEEETVAPARGAEPKEEKPSVIEEAGAVAAAKGKAKPGPAAAGAAVVAGAAARAPAPKRHFKPKKRPAKAASAVKETAVKQEHEGDDVAGGGSAAGVSGGGGVGGVEESKGTAAAEEGRSEGGSEGRSEGGSEGRRGTARSRRDAAAAAPAVDGGDAKASVGGSKRRGGGRGAAAGAVALPAAKEEPREQSSDVSLPAEGRGKGPAASGSEDTAMGEGATAAEAAAGGDADAAAAAAAAAAEEEVEWRTENKAAGGKSRGRGGGGSSKREEPATRPKVKPRSNRSKSKGK
ncbi:unnamed protein product [Ectocarpus sp. 6 AP-2014]